MEEKTLNLNGIARFAHFQLESFEVWLERALKASFVLYNKPDNHSWLPSLPWLQAHGEATSRKSWLSICLAEVLCLPLYYCVGFRPPISEYLA